MESKMDTLPSQVLSSLRDPDRACSPSSKRTAEYHSEIATPIPSRTNSTLLLNDEFDSDSVPKLIDFQGQTHIRYSQHGVLLWPAIIKIVPQGFLSIFRHLEPDYMVTLENNRPPLPMGISSYPPDLGERWIEDLPFSVIESLCDAFFTTFNPMLPVLDKLYFFSVTLETVVTQGFECNIESCLTLVIMGLGCLAALSHEEGDYPLQRNKSGSSNEGFICPEWIGIVREEIPGLRFFNLARQKMGFLMCKNDLITCQFYLLSG